MTQSVAAEMPRPLRETASPQLTGRARALLAEAMRLMDLEAPERAVEIALEELVERQRFLALVAEHERSSRDLDPGA